MAEETINWVGKSGKKYRYWIYDIGTPMKQVPGNYVFARRSEPGRLVAVYIGQTGDLSERFEYHHKMPCIRENRASHICTHTSSADEAIRKAEEDDLIKNYDPVCNR